MLEAVAARLPHGRTNKKYEREIYRSQSYQQWELDSEWLKSTEGTEWVKEHDMETLADFWTEFAKAHTYWTWDRILECERRVTAIQQVSATSVAPLAEVNLHTSLDSKTNSQQTGQCNSATENIAKKEPKDTNQRKAK